jgi:hypothetical protein
MESAAAREAAWEYSAKKPRSAQYFPCGVNWKKFSTVVAL